MSSSRNQHLAFLWILAGLACSSSSSSGYPKLVSACKTAVDCGPAGPEFVCEDGGCTQATCQCDDQCPAGLGCEQEGGTVGECVTTFPLTPCLTDAGPDGGVDAGLDSGVDAGPDSGVDAGPDRGVDAGPDSGVDAGPDSGVDAGLDGGVDAGPDGGHDGGSDGGKDGGKEDGGHDAG